MSSRKTFTDIFRLFLFVCIVSSVVSFEDYVGAEDISDIGYVSEENIEDGSEETDAEDNNISESDEEEGGANEEDSQEESSVENDKSSDSGNPVENLNEEVIEEFSCDNYAGIVISEFLMNPVGDDKEGEFIELYNSTDAEIDIAGYTIEDKGGKIFYFADSIISSREYEAFYYSETKIALNNTGGEGLILKYKTDDKECKISNISVNEDAKEGFSYAIDASGAWQWTIVPTPGTENVIDPGEEEEDDGGGNDNEDSDSATDDSSEDDNESSSSGGSSSSSGNSFSDNDADIIISEFLINPEGSDQLGEFIEIYNADDHDVNISGWSLEDQVGKVKSYNFPEGTIIRSGQYKTFYSYETGIALNNTGDGAILKNTGQDIIYETYLSDAAAEGVSCALDEDGVWQETENSTPGKENIIYLSSVDMENNDDKNDDEDMQTEEAIEYDFSDTIIITEIMPDPSGRDNKDGIYEWVEIYNTGTEDVDILGWFLDDLVDQGSKMYQFKESRIMEAGEYLTIGSDESKIFFNNSEDEVNVIWPDGIVVDSIAYGKSKEGYSYCLFEDGWRWSASPTPGKANILVSDSSDDTEENVKKDSAGIFQNSEDFSEAENEKMYYADGYVLGENDVKDFFKGVEVDYEYLSVSEIKTAELYIFVGTDGVVSVPPGFFGDDIFYITEAGSPVGLQIFSYDSDIPNLSLGDRVQVFGYISEVGGERRLVMDDGFGVEKISSDNPLEFSEISCGDANDNLTGDLVRVKGEIVKVGNSTFFVSDVTGDLKIYIKDSVSINISNLAVGDRVSVAGQLSRTSSGFRLLPRFGSDIRFLEEKNDDIIENEDVSGERGQGQPLYFQAFFFMSIVILVDWGRMRVKDKRQINR